MKTLLIALLFSTPVFADEMECQYIRAEKNSRPHATSFLLMPSRPELEKNFRTHGFRVKLADETFSVEAREGDKRKVATRSVKNAWQAKQEPSAPEVSFEFENAKVMVRCN